MRFIKTPANLLLLTAILLIVASLVHWNKFADIHVLDTNIRISSTYFYWLFAGIFIVLSLAYKLGKDRFQNEKLVFAHITLTFLSMLISFSVVSAENFIPKPADGKLLTAVILFLAGQICFIVNLTSGVSKKS